jgi:hypothetical protein
MSYNIAIEIIGSCNDEEALAAIIEAAENDASEYDWGRGADRDDIVALVRKAVDASDVLTLVKSDSLGLFHETRRACQDAGLHYVVSYGGVEQESFSQAIFYRAGGEEFTIPLDVMSEVIPVRDIREAVEKGIGAVRELVVEYDRKVLKDIDKSFTVPSGLLEAMEARDALTGRS